VSDRTPESLSLPDARDLDWLRKQAKRRLQGLREQDPGAKLADAQFEVARQYGFTSWRALKAHVDSATVEGRLFEAARTGDAATLTGCSTSSRTSCTRARHHTSTRCSTWRRTTPRRRRSSCYFSAGST
jgi:hypothetical protein